MKDKGDLLIITGKRNIGKTNACIKLVNYFKTRNLQISGIISLGLYENGRKVGILAKDIRTGEKKKLAVYYQGWDEEEPGRIWKFDDETLIWGNRVLAESIPTDILIIDELGYLEFEKDQGWIEGFNAIDEGKYLIAFIVVRNELLPIAKKKWERAKIFNIPKEEENLLAYIDQFVDLSGKK